MCVLQFRTEVKFYSEIIQNMKNAKKQLNKKQLKYHLKNS